MDGLLVHPAETLARAVVNEYEPPGKMVEERAACEGGLFLLKISARLSKR